MSWQVIFSSQAVKDTKKIARVGYKAQTEKLLQILADDPFKAHLRMKSWLAILSGFYARRSNIQHRLIYRVMETENTVNTAHVLRMWTHYE